MYEDEEDIESEGASLLRQWLQLRGVGAKWSAKYVERLRGGGYTDFDQIVRLNADQLRSVGIKEEDINRIVGPSSPLPNAQSENNSIAEPTVEAYSHFAQFFASRSTCSQWRHIA
jgi:hypothetical protein